MRITKDGAKLVTPDDSLERVHRLSMRRDTVRRCNHAVRLYANCPTCDLEVQMASNELRRRALQIGAPEDVRWLYLFNRFDSLSGSVRELDGRRR